MKKVIRKISDLKYYINEKTMCIVMSFILAFFGNVISVIFNFPFIVMLLVYMLLVVYSYFICTFLYNLFMPQYRKIKKSDFEVFLLNQGEPIIINKKFKLVFVNLFKKVVVYKTKLKNNKKVKFIFDFKKNTYKMQYYDDIGSKESA